MRNATPPRTDGDHRTSDLADTISAELPKIRLLSCEKAVAAEDGLVSRWFERNDRGCPTFGALGLSFTLWLSFPLPRCKAAFATFGIVSKAFLLEERLLSRRENKNSSTVQALQLAVDEIIHRLGLCMSSQVEEVILVTLESRILYARRTIRVTLRHSSWLFCQSGKSVCRRDLRQLTA
jgi:hypothetical protein